MSSPARFENHQSAPFLMVQSASSSRKQPGGEPPQRRLVADDEDRALVPRRAGRGDDIGDTRMHAYGLLRGVGQIERGGGLLGALGRARQDQAVGGQPRFEPLRHLLRLLQPFLGEGAPGVGHAVLGVGVAPEQQIRGEFSFVPGHAGDLHLGMPALKDGRCRALAGRPAEEGKRAGEQDRPVAAERIAAGGGRRPRGALVTPCAGNRSWCNRRTDAASAR